MRVRRQARGYTPLPPRLAHLDPPSVVVEHPPEPLRNLAPIRHPVSGWVYLGAFRPGNRTSLAYYILARDTPDAYVFIRFYEIEQHFREAWAMLQAGTSEEEIVAYEHRS
jgi:hypothetical protein